MPTPDGKKRDEVINSTDFINTLQDSLINLHGLELSGEGIRSIKCYLSGPRTVDRRFAVSKYLVVDKHGLTRFAYNAKINIYRNRGAPIYLGIPDKLIGSGNLSKDKLERVLT